MGERIALLENSADVAAVYPIALLEDQPYEEALQERHTSWLGAIALEQVVDVESLGLYEERKSLADLIELAANGDKQALAAVQMNASTTVYEAALKAGHITEITAKIGTNGLEQHGHQYEDIFRNTLIHANDVSSIFYYRKQIEALNWRRLEAAIQHGDLDDYWMIEISLPPEGQSTKALRKEGIFVDTMSGIFRGSTVADGVVHTESAFVAGMAEITSDAFETPEQKDVRLDAAMQHRFDIQAVRDMLSDLGVPNAQEMNPEDMLKSAFRIHKFHLKNGIASLVEMYDQRVGGVFFGQRKPKQDYATFAEQCEVKARMFEPLTRAVIRDLLANVDKVKDSPQKAVVMLDKLVEYHLQEAAYRNTTIDESIFGQEAIEHIRDAREKFKNNDIAGFLFARANVQRTSEVTRCGGGTNKDDKDGGSSNSQRSDSPESGSGGSTGIGTNSGQESDTKLKWRTGYCRIDPKVCLEKGKKTLVAQCDVCIKCQVVYFNKNVDPTKFSKTESFFSVSAFDKPATNKK